MILLRIHCRSNLRMCRDVNAPNTGAFRLLLWIHFREHFPRPQNPCHTPLIPPRIHRKALRRDGVGAGLEGKTRNLMHRVRGKWSPSGDPGEAAGIGPVLPFHPINSAGVPVWHITGWSRARVTSGAERPGLPEAVEDGADRQPWLRRRKPEGVHGRLERGARYCSHG